MAVFVTGSYLQGKKCMPWKRNKNKQISAQSSTD